MFFFFPQSPTITKTTLQSPSKFSYYSIICQSFLVSSMSFISQLGNNEISNFDCSINSWRYHLLYEKLPIPTQKPPPPPSLSIFHPVSTSNLGPQSLAQLILFFFFKYLLLQQTILIKLIVHFDFLMENIHCFPLSFEWE